MHVLGLIERAVNGALEPLGVRVVRRGGPRTIGGRRVSDDDVLALARRRGVPPGLLLEEMFGRPGRAEGIVARMRASGALSGATRAVCEIGPGSGLYVAPVLRDAPVRRYEVYEIEPRRAAWLAATFPVVAQPADGERLAGTADASMDLVHSHGVFVTLGFLTAASYLREIARVVAPGGWVVLDAVTEDCLDDAAIDAWVASGLRYPSLLPRAALLEPLAARGFALVDEFRLPLLVHGTSRYFILRRTVGGTD